MERYPYETSCRDKQRLSEQVARRNARKINEEQFEPVHAYPCSYCQSHHVGRFDPTVKDEQKEELEKIPKPTPTTISIEGLYRWSRKMRGLPVGDEVVSLPLDHEEDAPQQQRRVS